MSKEKLITEYDAFQKAVGEQVKELRKHFPPLFTHLFERHQWVESFSWRQCEPWRDGEETEFEVMCDTERIYINDLDYYDSEVYEDDIKKSAFAEFAAGISDVPTEVMKALFGESNEVEVMRTGDMLVREYSDG